MTFVDPIWVLANPHHRQGLELKTRCEQPSRSTTPLPSPPPKKKNQTNIQTKQNKPKKKRKKKKNAVDYYKVTNTKAILDLGGKS